MSRPNRSFEKKPSQRRTGADRDARAAARPKVLVDSGAERAALPLGKCDLDRIPHRPDVLCEDWHAIEPAAQPPSAIASDSSPEDLP